MVWRIREGEYDLYVEPCAADEYEEFMGDLGKIPAELADRFFEVDEAYQNMQRELRKFWSKKARDSNHSWIWRKTFEEGED